MLRYACSTLNTNLEKTKTKTHIKTHENKKKMIPLNMTVIECNVARWYTFGVINHILNE